MKQINTILLCFTILSSIFGQNPAPFIIQVHEEKIPWSDNAVYYFKVSNFNKIASLQFSITWDTLQLEYLNVNTYGPTDLELDSNNFYPNGFEQGIIAPLWLAENPLCKDLDDETTLMSFRFKNPGGFGKFDISNSPFFIEVTNCDGKFPDVIFIDNHGHVTPVQVGVISNTEAQVSDLISIHPNPAKNRIFLKWQDLNQIPDHVIFYSLKGEIIGRIRIHDQVIEIPDSIDPGSYLLMFQKSDQAIAVKKVLIEE